MDLSQKNTEEYSSKLANRLRSSNSWVSRKAAQWIREHADRPIWLLVAGMAISTDPAGIPQTAETRRMLDEQQRIERLRALALLAALPDSDLSAFRWVLNTVLSKLWLSDDPTYVPKGLAAERSLAAKTIGVLVGVSSNRQAVEAANNLGGDFSKFPKIGLASLAPLAKDAAPAVRHAVAVSLRQLRNEYLTISSNGGKPLQSDMAAVWEILGSLITTSAADADKTLGFAIWQALEPVLAGSSQDSLSKLADLAPKTKPLSQVLTYKSARRITDTRSGENMDLLLAFLDKLKDDDVLTAHALDGMLKAQEAGAVKPAKTDPAPFFARWAASKSADVRNHAGRLATLWGDKAAVTALIKVAEDPKADPAQRAEAIRTLRKLDSDEARAALLRLLEQSLPQ